MATTTLARRIRRIGQLPSTTEEIEGREITTRHFDLSIDAESRAAETKLLTEAARERRLAARSKQKSPAKPHRRSKARRKADAK